MNPKELEKEMNQWLQQITDSTESSRYLDALTTVAFWATAADGGRCKLNNELNSIFEIIKYYQAAVQVAAYEEGFQRAL